MAVDFSEWAAGDLTLTFGGRTYMVRPPSVHEAKQIIAAAVRGEVQLGLVQGEIPAEITEITDTIGDTHPALGVDVYEQMVADGVPAATIDRMAAYATFYWARGKKYADWLAEVMWKHHDPVEAAPAPKALPTSPRPSGRSTGSANPSTTTRTGSRSSATTASRRKSSKPPR